MFFFLRTRRLPCVNRTDPLGPHPTRVRSRSKNRVPPAGSRESFLEVARRGTVKAPASELGLSMPALSRRIQTLEHAVGRPLFDRHHHGLKLTEAGRALQVQLAPILDELRGAIGRVGGPDASLRLHLNVLPLFAQQR